MTTANTESALAFVARFAAGDLDGLGSLLGDAFHLNGPLFEFHSKEQYLGSLVDDVQEAASEMLGVTEDGERVMVVYEYRKAEATIMISQLFTFRDGPIEDTLLAFDTRGFE